MMTTAEELGRAYVALCRAVGDREGVQTLPHLSDDPELLINALLWIEETNAAARYSGWTNTRNRAVWLIKRELRAIGREG